MHGTRLLWGDCPKEPGSRLNNKRKEIPLLDKEEGGVLFKKTNRERQCVCPEKEEAHLQAVILYRSIRDLEVKKSEAETLQ